MARSMKAAMPLAVMEASGDHTAGGQHCLERIFSAPAGRSSRYICAPMVLQSELAFRALVRARGVSLCYSPMLAARPLASEAAALGLLSPGSSADADRAASGAALADLLTKHGYDGHISPGSDRPLLAQLAALDPVDFAAGCRLLCHELLGRERWPTGIDLNLGCPRGRAGRAGFGSVQLSDPARCAAIVAAGVAALAQLPLAVPVTAKI
eukprot:SAG22_NODE_7890_length_700_cov_0.815308_1_plen_209_part_10